MTRAHTSRRKSLTISLIAMGAFTLLGYQNCMDLPNQVPTTGSLSSSGAPFPFDVTADTFGYMSCDQMAEYDRSTYFTVRFGALRTAGLQISSDFRSYATEKRFNADKIMEVIQEDSLFSNSMLQTSARARHSPSGDPIGVTGLSQQYRVHRVFSPYTLGDDTLLYNLVSAQAGQRLKSHMGQPLIGQISLNEVSATQAQAVIAGEGLAILGFQKGAELNVHDIISPNDLNAAATPTVYGRGYMAGAPFASPRNLASTTQRIEIFPNHGARTLSAVTEQDVTRYLPSRPVGQSWTCPSYAVYRVVQIEHVVAPNATTRPLNGCNPNAVAPAPGSREADAYDATKKLLDLYPGRWVVDQENKCVIRVSNDGGYSSCYRSRDVAGIEWSSNPQSACGTSGRECPHYLSLCASYFLP